MFDKFYYRPVNVKDTIRQIKDTAELMLDLAYSSILFKEEYFGEEILDLEKIMEQYIFDGRVAVMLSARRIDEAESLSTILQILDSSKKISSVAVDLAKIELNHLGLPREFIKTMDLVDETITSIIIPSDSKNSSISVSKIEEETSMHLIAIKCSIDNKWIINPDSETVVHENDRLISKGPFEALRDFVSFIQGNIVTSSSLSEINESDEFKHIRKILVEMMTLSQLSIDIAYSSILFNNNELATEVSTIEDKLELLRANLTEKILLFSRKVDDVKPLRGILQIAYSSEKLSDASKEISDIIFSGITYHPVFAYALRESDEIITRVVIRSGSKLDGKSMANFNFEVETGMDVIALYKIKSEKWLYNPKGEILFEVGDIIIAKGDKKSEEILRKSGIAETE
jgi:uncharacterized protein with PhoU and TrkA domain